jgi:hypothetical protein
MKIFEIDPNEEKKLELQKVRMAGEELASKGLKVSKPKIADLTKQRHLRIENTKDDIERVVKSMGAQLNYDNAPQLSGRFTPFAIIYPKNYKTPELAGQTVYALSNIRDNTKVAQKQLIPGKFGLGGKIYKKSELVKILQTNIPKTIQDPVLSQFLLQLVDVAIGKRQKVDPAIMEQIDADTLRMTGIDFGEVLTPLSLAEDSDNIDFPSGNSMLADVEINGRPISVKSASGSGTSFKAIISYMNKFSDEVKAGTVTMTPDEEEIHKFFRAFVDTEGKNIDKIIAGSAAANTDEHKALAKLVGKKNFTYPDLVAYCKKFRSYPQFLKTIYPVSVAGNYKVRDKEMPNGLPQDYRYYMGLSDKQPTAKQTGKPSWDADKGKAGANILTYVLATSFLKDAKKEVKTKKYDALLKRILGGVNANLAKIDITPDGKINIKQTPFSGLDYQFQYHGPSHKPDNNLPGFSLVLD